MSRAGSCPAPAWPVREMKGLSNNKFQAGWCCILAVAAVLAATPRPALGHADVLERIADLNRQIEGNPGIGALYLKRGELHRLHRDWPAARADYKMAAGLAPELAEVDYAFGRMWHEAGRPDLARPALDSFLALRPHNADALLTRSRVLALLGEPRQAVSDLTAAIARLDPPTPEVYLERARLIAVQGPEHATQALKGIDAGVARLGPIVSLIQFAIDLEVGQGRYHAALARMDGLPAAVGGQPRWLARRGDILLAAGRETEAGASYAAGLETIAKLPPSRRRVRATAKLEAKLRARLRLIVGNR